MINGCNNVWCFSGLDRNKAWYCIVHALFSCGSCNNLEILPAVAGSYVVSTTGTSAVLFCAPKLEDTPIEPVVREKEGEERVYLSGIKAGQLRGKMARKWQKREGTLTREGAILEEQEILATNMFTQDDVVQRLKTCAAK